jgi:recombination protein RecA
MLYGEGISREGDLLDLASERGLVQKSGAWYAYQEDRIGQGREHAKTYLKEHPEVATAIAQQLRQTLGLARVALEPLEGADLTDARWGDEDKEA